MSEYVTNGSWVRTRGRLDAIDEIADQFERRVPAPPLPVPVATHDAAVRWPRSARGWRSLGRLHPRSVEQRSAR